MTADAGLAAAGLDPDDVVQVIRRALAEDLGTAGDVTSASTIPADAVMTGHYAAREAGIAAGLPVLAALVARAGNGARIDVRLMCSDGDRLEPGSVLAEINGDARTILGIERLSLNLLGHLSGIATATAAWVAAVAGTGARIRDTRKTTPGLRDLEKYAVRCGGGTNHRRGLDDAVLIKDNHVAAAGGIGAALDAVHATDPAGRYVVQIEVDDLTQLTAAIEHGARHVLLDNFSIADMTEAVALVRATGRDITVEASGGLQASDAAAVAATGVDFIAVGALTHSARSLDIGLDTV